MTLPYTDFEYDACGWSTLSASSLSPFDTYGLDYESARDATPRWYGVSSGNGNDGVSHTFPDYYVRTSDPWRLAELACVTSFKAGKSREWAKENVEVDGEPDYTLSATIYEGPDGETEFGAAWLIYEVFPVDPMPSALLISDSTNECFNVEYNPYGNPAYCSLKGCFGEAVAEVPAEA